MSEAAVRTIAKWRVIRDILGGTDVGIVVARCDLADAVGVDEVHVSNLVSRARVDLLENADRYPIAVRGEGYRIASASEHAPLARLKVGRAYVATMQAVSLTVNVRRAELSADEAQRLDRYAEVALFVSRQARESVQKMDGDVQ